MGRLLHTEPEGAFGPVLETDDVDDDDTRQCATDLCLQLIPGGARILLAVADYILVLGTSSRDLVTFQVIKHG